jgi:hypothetical protein
MMIGSITMGNAMASKFKYCTKCGKLVAAPCDDRWCPMQVKLNKVKNDNRPEKRDSK